MASQTARENIQSSSSNEARRLSTFALLFSILFAIFVLGPPFLGFNFGPYPLMKVADVMDLLTPLLVLPFYWLLFRVSAGRSATTEENVAFMVLVGFFALGQGTHLAANSIGHLTEGLTGTDVFKLTAFYDEKLSHYLWHFGVIGLSLLLMYRQRKNPFSQSGTMYPACIAAGTLYGFTFFAMVIEGATWPMGLPLAVLAAVLGAAWIRRRGSQQPLVLTFFLAYSLALVLFAVWAIWQHGLPEFSKVGFI